MKNKNITPRRSPRRGEQSFSLIFSDKLSEYSENKTGQIFRIFKKLKKKSYAQIFRKFKILRLF